VSEASSQWTRRATELREAFDRGFAEPVRPPAERTSDFLSIRIGAEACALRLAEIASLHADKKITKLPESDTALLGIAGFRGVILPVYSLPGLLGQAAEDAPRWLVVASITPVALAFDGFEGHLRVASDTVLPHQIAGRHAYARDYVRTGSLIRPVIDLAAVLAAILNRRPEQAPEEER
jgi:chemotaxis signal transduction protein